MDTIFRNYDIRGEYGLNLTEDAIYKAVHAYVEYAKPKKVVVGRDVRSSSASLKQKVVQALVERGIEVLDIGMVSTDAMYFATWFYHQDGGIIVTASHMPKQYNGLKFLRLNEKGMLTPIGRGLGMEELERFSAQDDIIKVVGEGKVIEKDIWDDFVTFTRSFVDINAIKKLKIVMDAGNGMGGLVAEKLFAGMDLDVTKLFFEPDGTFPNHSPNPLVEEGRKDIMAKVKEVGVDLGIAWDADCDRVFFIDEKGNYVDGDFIIVLLAIQMLEKNPGAGIVYDLRASWAVRDWIEKKGGVSHVERVGHTYIKKRMQDTQSVFGGEVSAHYYFAKNAYMENGFAPALLILELMSKTGKKLSELIAELGDYYISGEINFKVKDIPEVLARLEQRYGGDAQIERMDGLSFVFSDWHFNVRPSANDPVVRLNVEAKSQALLEQKLKEIEDFIQK